MVPPPLSGLTTLGVGGPARELVHVEDVAALADVLARADAGRQPVLVLGGGSNVVVADEGFDGTVVQMALKGVRVSRDGEAVVISAQAGEEWCDLVARCVGEGLAGTECLSGIPGLVGATPVQNVGAYGQEVAQVVRSVTAWDRSQHRERSFRAADCRFAYRHSIFKGEDRYVVTEVTFALFLSELGRPIAYAELASRLGTKVGARAPLAETAAAVMSLRRSKGMVLDPDDPDTRSAGSFFINPVLTDAQISTLQAIAPGMPQWPAPGGTKVPAAWLVEKAGFSRGYSRGGAAISSKHALALTVKPGGTAADLLDLAREVRTGVFDRFGVRLEPEPVIVGTYL